MKVRSKYMIRIIIVILVAAGLFLAYFNVLNSRFRENTGRRKIQKISEKLLKYPTESNRMQCNSTVYLDMEEKKKDEIWDMQVLHDFEHQRMRTTQGNYSEIFEYEGDEPRVYSKGVSPVYIKEKTELRKIPTDRWFKYLCELQYGWGRKKGITDRISYGYLASGKYLKRLYSEGKEEIDGVTYERYTAEIWNTNKPEEPNQEGDNDFRKCISANGLDAMELRKDYPDVYKLLKSAYQKETEKMSVWLDSEGKLAFIEKDYTFPYYLNVMKENSEVIEKKVGAYDYPKVVCRQSYIYSPNCGSIELPEKFEEI